MRSWKIVLFAISVIGFATDLQAQYFGRNKPNYETFDFEVHESPHFRFFQYLGNDSLANALVRQSERWYLMHQQIFRDTFPDKNPIIFYNNHPDFQQSTVISGTISVGTGGVTEGLKNRVIMPVSELNGQTHHVLGHELVHVFQYRMLKNPDDSLSLQDISNIPLWMVEGLAEYLSLGSKDAHTAMWMRDAVQQDDIPTLEDLSKGYKYFPYRYGHAFWSFVSGAFGDTVIYPLFRETAKLGLKEAIKKVTGIEEREFSRIWKERLVDYYTQFEKKLPRDSTSLKHKLLSEDNSGEINIAPVISPNGRYVAYLSEKNFFTIDLFLADASTGEVLKTLSSQTRQGHIDEFSYVESGGTWSPQSDRFAFPVYAEGQVKLAIADIGRSEKLRTISIPGVKYFSNPSWSPGGDEIVVSGLVHGQSDLYVYNLKTRNVRQLTNDHYADYQPQWSADGSRIAFVTDRPAAGQAFDLGALQLAVYSGAQVEVMNVFPGAKNLNPVFSAEDDRIYFLSDRDGFRNLYSMNLTDRTVYQHTHLFTGISGITQYSPALSLSRKTGDIVFSHFSGGKYAVYRADPLTLASDPVQSWELDQSAGFLPPAERSVDIVNHNLGSFTKVDVEVNEVPFKSQFELEYIGNNVGVGVATGEFGTRTGLAGGVNAIFGDVLGRHKLFTSVSLNGEIYDIGGQVAYLNQKHRVNYGVSVSHIPYRSSSLGVQLDTLSVGDSQKLPVVNYTLNVLRIFEDNATVFAHWPFNQTRRVEAGVGYSLYSFRADRINNYYAGYYKVGEERERLDAPEGYQLGNAYTAYVFDNSYFGLASPFNGKRYRLELSKVYDELNYHTLSLDYRQYFFLNPTAIAFRAIHVARYGSDAENERLYPLSFAYPVLTRGNSLSNLNSYGAQVTGNYNINQIFGSRMLVTNLEWRLPFTGPARLALIKSRMFLSEWALFIDGGLAWTTKISPTLELSPKAPDDRVPFISSGVSFRLNLFGQVVLEPYYAFPWRGDYFDKGVFGLNLSPGW